MMKTKEKPKTSSHMKKSPWYSYLWISSGLYLILGVFNILFAWLGILCFVIPLMVAALRGNKAYCNKYCGRGQLFDIIGKKLKLSRNKVPPRFLSSKLFRYAFLTFFMTMFGLMIFSTYKVFSGASLNETVALLWVFKVPWNWASTDFVSPWIAKFAFGFFGVMLTSTVLGFITAVLYRPRSWCVYCPMGTMTQGICMIKNHEKIKE